MCSDDNPVPPPPPPPPPKKKWTENMCVEKSMVFRFVYPIVSRRFHFCVRLLQTSKQHEIKFMLTLYKYGPVLTKGVLSPFYHF